MASSSEQPGVNPITKLPSDFMTKMAANYGRHTGDSTRAIFAASWDEIQSIHPITSSSVIHDNAGGPGISTSVIVEKLTASGEDVPQVLITDNTPAMIDAAKTIFAQHAGKITAEVEDSQTLSAKDDTFTHSILSFSVFLFEDPVKGLSEMRRTLRPDGLAALLCWKRFGAGSVVHAAQAKVRPDLPPMKIPGKQFMDEGVLHQTAVDAGFDPEKMTFSVKEFVARSGEPVDGLRGFFLEVCRMPATMGWTDEEKGKYEDAIGEAIEEEVAKNGGIKFEAYVILARK